MARTLQQLMTEVRTLIDEPEEDYFLDREIITWLNEGLMDMSLEVRLETSLEIPVETPSKSVPLPTDFISMRSVYVDGKPFKIGVIEDRDKPNNRNLCYIWGNDLKFPTAIQGSVELFYLRDPRRMVLMTDTAEIPTRYAHLLVIYALSKAKLKDEEQAIANDNMQNYLRLKYEMIDELKQRQMLEGTHFVEGWGGGY